MFDLERLQKLNELEVLGEARDKMFYNVKDKLVEQGYILPEEGMALSKLYFPN